MSSLKCNLARRVKLLNRTKCLLKYIGIENSCQPGSCEPGIQAWEPETYLKNEAVGLFKIYPGCLETRDILRYHQKVQKQGPVMTINNLIRWKRVYKIKSYWKGSQKTSLIICYMWKIKFCNIYWLLEGMMSTSSYASVIWKGFNFYAKWVKQLRTMHAAYIFFLL